MYTGKLIVMTFSVAAFTLNNVVSRPSPESPIKYPDEPPSENINPVVRNPTRSRRPAPSPKLTSFRNRPVCANARSTFCENVTNYPSNPPGGYNVKLILSTEIQHFAIKLDFPRAAVRDIPDELLKMENLYITQDEFNHPSDQLQRSVSYSREEFVEIFGPVDLYPKSRVKEEDLADERICSQQTKIFYPKAAKNEDDEWMFVVNDVNYVQMVISEVCDTEDSACLYVDNNLPAGFGSKCKQLFAHKRLLALDSSGKRSHIASFRFPSCCVCFVRYPIGWTQSRAKSLT